MKLEHSPFSALRAKGRSLRRKNDHTRIQASSTVACDGSLSSPKLSQGGSSHEDLTSHGSTRTSSADSVGHLHHHHHLQHHDDFSNNSPVLLRGDKELHDPEFVRHNWEMMSGESTYPDNQLHIGRAASPKLASRRSTLSSRTGSSRPSSRSGSETGGHHTPTFGLGVSAFSGLSSYSQAGSVGRASGSRASSSTRGLLVEGSILRDEEAILDSDDDSSDDDDDDDAYRHDTYSAHRHLSTSRRTSPSSQLASLPPRSPLPSAPVSPLLTHALEQQQHQQQAAAYHRRRHWTVAQGSQASNGAGLHALSAQVPRGAAPARSFSQPA